MMCKAKFQKLNMLIEHKNQNLCMIIFVYKQIKQKKEEKYKLEKYLR